MDYGRTSELSVELQILANFIPKDELSSVADLPQSYLRALYPQFLGPEALLELIGESGEKVAYKIISDYEPVKAWSKWLDALQHSEAYIKANDCVIRGVVAKPETYESQFTSRILTFRQLLNNYRCGEINSLIAGFGRAEIAILLDPLTLKQAEARSIVVQPVLSLLRGDLR